jgi:hypothetical protein
MASTLVDKQDTDFKAAVLAASGDPITVPPSAGHLTLSKVRGYTSHSIVTLTDGRAIDQAVTRRLPTAASRVRTQVRSCKICGAQSGTAAGFLRALRFPLPILIPPTAVHLSSAGAGTTGQSLAD